MDKCSLWQKNKNPTHQSYTILTATVNDKGYAESSFAHISQEQACKMPLPPTTNNLALLVNHLMGETYGWGGKESLHDCSALLKDLFIPPLVYGCLEILERK